METVITAAILLVIVGLALRYVIKAKKSGTKCIGCPNGCCSGSCGSHGGSCTCGKSGQS